MNNTTQEVYVEKYLKILNKAKRWNENNKEKTNLAAKKYREKNRELCLERVLESQRKKKLETLDIKITINEEFLKTLNLQL